MDSVVTLRTFQSAMAIRHSDPQVSFLFARAPRFCWSIRMLALIIMVDSAGVFCCGTLLVFRFSYYVLVCEQTKEKGPKLLSKLAIAEDPSTIIGPNPLEAKKNFPLCSIPS